MSEENEEGTGVGLVTILVMLGTAIALFLLWALFMWAIIVGEG